MPVPNGTVDHVVSVDVDSDNVADADSIGVDSEIVAANELHC